ncbi:MAG: triose-phosphate isomerase [Bacteroidetes bacterium]|nr:MAG: triose-phosphate isomerase [Bacteroidota bacterium]
MRQKIVAGNWKMNKTFEEADNLLFDITKRLEHLPSDVQLIVCPPALYLELATDIVEEDEVELKIGAQNVSQFENGAYTGEISASMLSSMNMDYCIVGHSERRKYFGETHEMLAQKVDRLLEYGIEPIFCCGEVLEERESNKHFEVVKAQIADSLFHLSEQEMSNVVIAYEPVWAIGTGKTASSEQAQEMHAYIRGLLKEKYGNDLAEEISILYGGSCNPGNAKELFANEDVDGGLIGGAALKADDFLKIAQSF